MVEVSDLKPGVFVWYKTQTDEDQYLVIEVTEATVSLESLKTLELSDPLFLHDSKEPGINGQRSCCHSMRLCTTNEVIMYLVERYEESIRQLRERESQIKKLQKDLQLRQEKNLSFLRLLCNN